MKTLAKESDLAELIARLQQLSAGSQRQWGKMSLSEMLCHLADAGENVLNARIPAPGNGLKPKVMRIVALYLPIPWPKGVVGRPGPKSEPGDFERERQRVIASLEGLATSSGEALAPGHPLFGKLSLADWQRWAYKHVDHHLRQFGQ